jgi:hypothetical protein
MTRSQGELPSTADIKPDTSLRLTLVPDLALADGLMTVSGLRREAALGRFT